MFSVKFNDLKTLRNFLSLNVSDYADAIFDGRNLLLVVNSNEIFACYRVPAVGSASQQPVSFRVNKKLLSLVSSEESLEIVCEDSSLMVSAVSNSGVENFSCTFAKQIVPVSEYYDKLEIADSVYGKKSFNLRDFSVLCKIARLCGGVIAVGFGSASVVLSNGVHVFKKYESNGSFSFTSSAFSSLRLCGNSIANVEDYLATSNGNFCVMARKSRMQPVTEYAQIVSAGAKFIADVDFSKLFRFMDQLKSDAESICVSVDLGCCIVSTMRSEFKIPVPLKNVRFTQSVGELEFPISVIDKVLRCFGSCVFNLRVTKNFMQLAVGDYAIVW